MPPFLHPGDAVTHISPTIALLCLAIAGVVWVMLSFGARAAGAARPVIRREATLQTFLRDEDRWLAEVEVSGGDVLEGWSIATADNQVWGAEVRIERPAFVGGPQLLVVSGTIPGEARPTRLQCQRAGIVVELETAETVQREGLESR